MAKVWKITACEEHMKGGPPRKQYFLVALPDQFAAMSALRKRPTLRDADLTVVGEASPEEAEWLDAKDGEIFCVMPIFMTRHKRSPHPAQASGEVEDRQSARQKRTPKRKSQRRKSTPRGCPCRKSDTAGETARIG
jgi:hypothetical protein